MKTLLASVAILIAATLPAIADDMAYMTTNVDEFGTLDLNTGVFSLLGNSGTTLGGLGVFGGTLYGATNEGSEIFTVNPANGSLTPVGNSGIADIFSFGSTVSGLFAFAGDGNLYSINPVTGAGTLIGATGVTAAGFTSLSTNSSTLYLEGEGNLYTVNTSTGAASLVGPLSGGTTTLGGMVLESGTLYGGQIQPSHNVDSVNQSTGAATQGPAITGTSADVFGLAPDPLPIPEPSTLGLFATGLLLARSLIARRR